MEEDINTLLNNKPEAVRYRRSLSTLIILGTGIIVFGFWGIIKLAAQLFFGIDLFRPGDLDGFDETAKMIVDEWLAAKYEGGRHQTRVDMIAEIEQTQHLRAAEEET